MTTHNTLGDQILCNYFICLKSHLSFCQAVLRKFKLAMHPFTVPVTMYGEVLCHSHGSAYLFLCTHCFTYINARPTHTHTHSNVSAVDLYFHFRSVPPGWLAGGRRSSVCNGRSIT